MSDSHDNPPTDINDAAIILPIMAAVLLLSIIPPAVILITVRIAHPEYFRRDDFRQGDLPTAEQPTDKRAQHNPIFRRARAVVLKFRGVAIAASGAIALRSREVFDRLRGRMSGSFDDRGRRCSDLPVMRNKSWQLLAESHTELTLTGSKDDGVQHETVEMAENPKKAIKIVHFDLGDEHDKEPSVQKPEPAVVAEVKT